MILVCLIIASLTVEQINNCVKQLKYGKAAAPDGLTAEHFKYAHPSLVVHLKLLMHLMLSYGHAPEAFGFGLIIIPGSFYVLSRPGTYSLGQKVERQGHSRR